MLLTAGPHLLLQRVSWWCVVEAPQMWCFAGHSGGLCLDSDGQASTSKRPLCRICAANFSPDIAGAQETLLPAQDRWPVSSTQLVSGRRWLDFYRELAAPALLISSLILAKSTELSPDHVLILYSALLALARTCPVKCEALGLRLPWRVCRHWRVAWSRMQSYTAQWFTVGLNFQLECRLVSCN